MSTKEQTFGASVREEDLKSDAKPRETGPDMKNPAHVRRLIEACLSANHLLSIVARVMNAHDGKVPEFWEKDIIKTGVLDAAKKRVTSEGQPGPSLVGKSDASEPTEEQAAEMRAAWKDKKPFVVMGLLPMKEGDKRRTAALYTVGMPLVANAPEVAIGPFVFPDAMDTAQSIVEQMTLHLKAKTRPYYEDFMKQKPMPKDQSVRAFPWTACRFAAKVFGKSEHFGEVCVRHARVVKKARVTEEEAPAPSSTTPTTAASAPPPTPPPSPSITPQVAKAAASDSK